MKTLLRASIAITLFFFSGMAFAQGVTTAWVNRLDKSNYDDALAVAVDANGNVAVTGVTLATDSDGFETDIYTVKYAASGATLWEARFDSSTEIDPLSIFSDDVPRSLVMDAVGNVIVAGTAQASNHHGDEGNLVVMKFDATTGSLLWRRTCNGSYGNGYVSLSTDSANAVAVDASGNVFVAGYLTQGFPEYGAFDKKCPYLAKYNGVDGTILWEVFDGDSINSPSGSLIAVAVDSDGNVSTLGNVSPQGYPWGLVTAKYSGTTGAAIWTRSVAANQSHGQAIDLALDGSGNVAITGVLDSFYTAKYSSLNGATIWETSDDCWPLSIATDAEGNVIVSGEQDAADGGDILTVKHSAADGTLLWTKVSNGGFSDYAGSVRVAPDGNVVIAGWQETADTRRRYTAKLNGSTGNVIWEALSNGPTYEYNQSLLPYDNKLAISPNGEVIVTGSSGDEAGYGDFLTTKYVDVQFPLQTLAATNITATSVRLNGTITPGAVDFSLRFEWSLNAISAPRPPLQSFNATSTATPFYAFAYSPPTPFFTDLTNLLPHTTYHFRARADFGPSTAAWGEDLTFTTLNRNPVAATDSMTVSYQSSFPVFPLTNDTEPDGDTLTLTSFTQPTHGTVTRSGDTLTYTADAGYYGLDSFTYTVTDGVGGNTIGTVNVTVTQTFNVWLNQHNLTGPDALDDADPDGDGLKNIMEFALGTLPKGSSVTSNPLTLAPGSPVFQFIYQKNKLAANSVTYDVQWSDSLTGPWVSTGVTESILSEEGIIQQVKALVPVGTNGHRFVRLRVTKL